MRKLLKCVDCFLCVAQWLPVILLFAIILWSYYAYVFVLCLENVSDNVEKAVFIMFYHVFFILFIWSYWKTILTHPGSIPVQFYLSADDQENLEETENPNAVLESLARKLPVQTLTNSNTVRFCEVCQALKPDRCHHCSMCKACRLKMDHHCPWVNNCVGFRNYKFFVLFLFHASLYTMFISFTTLPYFIKVWAHIHRNNGALHLVFLFFVAVMFTISLWTLLGYHVYLISVNRTTLESMRAPVFRGIGPDKHGYNLGICNNIRQVFGKSRWLWCLPISTTLGDGLVYPIRQERSPETVDLLNSRDKWLDDGSDDESEIRHHETYTYVETINEIDENDPKVIVKPDVVMYK